MKRIILTGASDGLGKSLGLLFCKKGYEVVALCRNKPSYECEFIKTDLSEEKSVLLSCEKIKKSYNSFDALINCAGVVSLQKSDNITFDETNKAFKINTISPVILTSNLLNLIKKNKADIVNISSIAGTLFDFEPDSIVYSASKWGLRGVTFNLQKELELSASRVININPCGMKTRFLEKYDNNLKGISDNWVDTDEIAKIIDFMLSVPKSIQFTDVTLTRKTNL